MAKKHHDSTITKHITDPNTICIYTDGSGIDGKVGAAVYTRETTKQQHLGKDADDNVFAAKLTAIDLGIQIVKETNHMYENCFFYVDSQAAIQAVMKPFHQSGQHIIGRIHDKLDELTMNITIVWIPGHIDISENEKADDAAKHAAQNEGLGTDPSPPTMKAVRNIIIKQRCKEEWEQRWNKGKDAKQLRRISKQKGVKNEMELYQNISRQDTA